MVTAMSRCHRLNMSRFERRFAHGPGPRWVALLNIFLVLLTTRTAWIRPMHSVDPRYVSALLAYEDQWFWLHPGVNPFAMMQGRWPVDRIDRARRVSGGSTITMQVARLLEPKPRTVANKWVEIVRAHAIGVALLQALRFCTCT